MAKKAGFCRISSNKSSKPMPNKRTQINTVIPRLTQNPYLCPFTHQLKEDLFMAHIRINKKALFGRFLLRKQNVEKIFKIF